MGRERNVPLTERTGRALKFSDPEICKYALAGLCPYGLFRNTKSDLGESGDCSGLQLSPTDPAASSRELWA